MLALLVNGVRPVEIVTRLGFSRHRYYQLRDGIYSKTGLYDVAALTAWAKEYALDEILPPETGETRPLPGTPKPRYKQRIKLGRMRGTVTKRRKTRWARRFRFTG